ncbi:hypothetical protein QBC38DRAFT_486380 [Podospora fimiseda]|uniref:Cell wall cysteine-rich protein n=1 Tax=Podospora fimiseda TaxID=252190 RepID=A0AAN7BIB3_9PEZI|nr:hypothetical protein QBC38DRAFT_486380 [Podospora fimiseda]
MVRRLNLLATLLGGAACGAATEITILAPGKRDLLFNLPSGTAPKGLYSLSNDEHKFAVPLDFNFPIRSLQMNDFKPEPHPLRPNDMVCCPPGTFFDPRTQQCAFLASSICPEHFTLDPATKSICISETPPCEGELYLDNGRCVSPKEPTCPDSAATYDKVTHECTALLPPRCDKPLRAEGAHCVSMIDKPECRVGYRQQGTLCILIAGPTCGTPEQNLVVAKDADGKAICVSSKGPSCPDGSKPDHDKCTVTKPPSCPPHFENKDGSCIYKGNLCPEGGEYKTFEDERAPVCRKSGPATCPAGDLNNNAECVSKESPCKPGFKLTSDGKMCVREEKLQCEKDDKIFFSEGPDETLTAFCCPDLPGMTLDDHNRCSFPATTEDCPPGMERDDSNEICYYTPESRNCKRGTLDPHTHLCIETTTAECKYGGTPDPITGLCNFGPPTCTTPGAIYDPKDNKCYLSEEPTCPPKSKPIAGECISEETSTCPDDAYHSADKSKCIYSNPPTCDGDSVYSKELQLCVVPNKPICNTNDPSDNPQLDHDSLTCHSPAPPACPANSDTEYDATLNKCVGRAPPKCTDPNFVFSPTTLKCVSPTGPTCEHLGKGYIFDQGKCISDSKPQCPDNSNWVDSLKACVSDKPPCPENTPTVDGKCVSSKPPTCKAPGTEFVPGIGCVAVHVNPKCTAGTKLNNFGECESTKGPECKGEGLVPMNGVCVSIVEKPACPEGTQWGTGGKCVATTPANCEGGLVGTDGKEVPLSFDKDSGKCIGPSPRCPEKTTLDGGMAKCITASARTCFALLACPDVADDIPVPAIE